MSKMLERKRQEIFSYEGFGFPVVLKGLGARLTHKTERGLVRLNLKDPGEVRSAAAAVASAAGEDLEGYLIQPLAAGRREFVAGLFHDAQFGPVVMFGLGGVLVEVLKDVSFRIVPLDKGDAADMMSEIQGKKLLRGFRGQDPADVPYLQDMLVKLSDFVNVTPGIEEIDMNPVFAYKDGAVVVDARIILSA